MVDVRFTGSHYYLIVNHHDRTITQTQSLNIELVNYVGELLKFGGQHIIDGIYLKDKEGAEKAKDWVESIFLMQTLEEVDYESSQG